MSAALEKWHDISRNVNEFLKHLIVPEMAQKKKLRNRQLLGKRALTSEKKSTKTISLFIQSG